jgi:hypothetical protein
MATQVSREVFIKALVLGNRKDWTIAEVAESLGMEVAAATQRYQALKKAWTQNNQMEAVKKISLKDGRGRKPVKIEEDLSLLNSFLDELDETEESDLTISE